MSRQLEVELTVTTERAEPEAPKPHTGRRGTQGVCVDKNLPAAHGYLRDLRSGATGTRLGSGCCTAASAGCSPRRATAVVVFSFVSRRPTLSSRGVPRQLIYTGFCARLHATRSEHQSTYCQCHSLWDTRTAPARLPRSGHSNAISVVRWSRLGPAAAPCTKRYLATEHNCLPSQRTVVGKHACLPPAPPPPPSSVQ